MGRELNGVTGFGYEGTSIDDFVGELQRWQITTLVDVRLNPISRKKGFSKRALSETLVTANIAYLHFPELGNPRDNREGFADDGFDRGREARDRFKNILDTDEATARVIEIADIASKERVGVMCFEASELHCHRHQVIRKVQDRMDELVKV